MAVSKELLARYKELKAQGVNVTLSELKAQLEAEEAGAGVGVNDNNTLTSEAPKPTGFAALSACQKQEPEPVQTYNEPTYNEPQQENSWSTSYYSQNENNYETPTESYTSSFESAGSSMMQSSSIESYSYGGSTYNEPSYSEPQQSYYQEPQQPAYTEPQQTYYQEPVYQQPQPEPVYQPQEQTYYQPEPQPIYEQPQPVQTQSYTIVTLILAGKVQVRKQLHTRLKCQKQNIQVIYRHNHQVHFSDHQLLTEITNLQHLFKTEDIA